MKILPISLDNSCSSIDFWDQWIGEDEIDYRYLSKHINNNHKTLILIDSKNTIEGVLIYDQVWCSNIYRIYLIAKRNNSTLKGVGKEFIQYFGDHFHGRIILSDDSEIPNYYEKLGFSKDESYYYKYLLNDWDFPLYTKII